MLKAFLVAVSFLTRIPVMNMEGSKNDWEKSPIYFPIIGLIIGLLLSILTSIISPFFPETVIAFLLLLFWIWITGGLHLDGWMDLADGLGSNASQEKMLVIMKDSRVGAFGVLAAILLLGGKYIFLLELLKIEMPYLFLLPTMLARYYVILAIKYWPYKESGGMGEGLRTHLTTFTVIVHLLWISLLTYYILGVQGIMVLIVAMIISLLFLLIVYRRLKVLTGDCYGALIEWTEVTVLFLLLFLEKV